MAKTIRDEDLRLNIIINGDNGRKQMGELERAIHDTNSKLETLYQKRKKLEDQGKQDTQAYRNLSAQIGKHTKAIDGYRERLAALHRQQSINTMTLSELTSHINRVRAQLSKVDPGTPLWKQLNAELKKSSARLAELRAQSKATGGAICTMAERANRYIGLITAGFASLTAAFSGISRAKQAFQEWDESIANAMKTTQLSREEMLELDKELKKLDTRTSQNNLLGLARTAGKLGIEGKDNILQFVSAADKINIALGEDLGDNAEEALREIGKLVDIFSLDTDYGIEQAMLKVGSTINSLGMASTANEGYIVNFTKRIAGIAPNADISIDKVLGLAATLDKYGQMSETAATAVGQTITGMYKRTEEFARVARMSFGDFKELLEKDANEAFLRVLEGMNRGGEGMATVVQALDSLHLNGQRASTVLGSLAKHSDELRNQQLLANQAFVDGSSVIEEYNIKNETATAIMEKRKKAVLDEAVALGETLTPAINVSLSAGTWLLKGMSALVTVGIKYRSILFALGAAYLTNVGLKKAHVAWTKLQVFWTKAHRIDLIKEAYHLDGATRSTMALSVAKNLLAGNVRAASVAFKSFWASIGPIGWATMAVGALVGVVSALRNKSEEALDLSKEAAQITDQEGNSLVGKAEKMRHLMSVIENTNIEEERRNAAMRELQSLMPNGINLINQETIASGKAAQAVKAHSQALIDQAVLQAALKKKQELLEQAGKDKLEGNDREVGFWTKMGLWQIASDSYGMYDYNELLQQAQDEASKNYQENLDKQLAEIDAKIAEYQQKTATSGNPIVNPNPDTTVIGGGGDFEQKWSLSSDEAYLQKRLALKKKYQTSETMTEEEYNAALLQLEIDTLTARLNANVDSGAERVAIEEQLADKLIKLKERTKKAEEKAAEEKKKADDKAVKDAEEKARKEAKIEMDIAEMSGNRIAIEKAKYEKLKQEYAGNARALEALEKAHKARLAKIQLEESNKEVEARQNAYKIARMQMVERQRQEMETFSGTERQRREKRKEHWEDLNKLDEKYLNEMIATLTTLVNDAKVGDIEIGVSLSDEDKAKLLKQIADLREQLAKLKGADNDTANSESFGGSFLGLGGDEWQSLLDGSLEGWKEWADAIADITAALGDQVMELWGSIDDYMSATEKAQLKEYEKNNDKKKKTLEKRLNAGLITEAQYKAEVEAMDAEYEAYQEELALKQAKRQKAMSITESVINTAVGVTKSLTGLPWPINLIAAAATLAMGVAQTALIAAQPITTGAEDGGPIGVRREQDGKPFQARLNPNKRGFVSSPTVLVAENGLEYVMPNEVMRNPTVYPLLSAMETARQNGTLETLDFSAIYSPYSVRGREVGGYIGDIPGSTLSPSLITDDSGEVKALLLQVLSRLSQPLDARVVMLGKNGLLESLEKHNKQKNRGKIGG